MVFENSEIINFTLSDYTSNKPSFGDDGDYSGDLIFANKNKTIDINGISHGYVAVEVVYSGDTDYGSVYFSQPNGVVISVSNGENGPFQLSSNTSKLENIFLDSSVSGITTFYIVVNSDLIKSNLLNVAIALGKIGSPPSTSSVTINFTCINAIYDYSSGVHVYSPYDAVQATSTLSTNLYSFEPIENWISDTKLYSTSKLDINALPYYYGIGNNVYKVGSEFTRSFGVKKSYHATKDISGNVTIKEVLSSSGSVYDEINGTSEACVYPSIDNSGLINTILNVPDLIQPLSYRYFMGFSTSDIKKSNDDFFTKYNYPRRTYDPITGANHALSKLGSTLNPYYEGEWSEEELLELSESINSGEFYIIDENCKKFRLFFTNSPYINLADVIFNSNDLLFAESGYYCDGVYFYQQTIALKNLDKVIKVDKKNSEDDVSFKILSYTNSVSSYNPLSHQLEYSIKADVPTNVVDYENLMVLPYCSGEPTPYCGDKEIIYYNSELTHVIDFTGGDMEICESLTITIPYGTTYSCISQIDADTKAQELLDIAIEDAQETEPDCTPIQEPFPLQTKFTHELKIENSTTVNLYYNSQHDFPELGDTLYFDMNGKYKVLNGFYSYTDKITWAIFLHTTDGVVDNIYYMEHFNDTHTSTGEPIIQTNLDHSSNWYLFNENQNTLLNEVDVIKDNNPNDLYINPRLRAGIYNSTTPDDLQIFDSFPVTTGTTYNEGSCGWYQPLVPWISQEEFYYCGGKTIVLDLEENCSYFENGSEIRGFYVVSMLGGIESPTIYPVVLTVNVWGRDSGFITTYTGVTTSPTESRTFFQYDEQVTPDNFIYKVEIVSIEIPSPNPNPENKITYNVGHFTDCEGVCEPLGELSLII